MHTYKHTAASEGGANVFEVSYFKGIEVSIVLLCIQLDCVNYRIKVLLDKNFAKFLKKFFANVVKVAISSMRSLTS